MNTRHEPQGPAVTQDPFDIFSRGFVIRLIYGSLALPLIALVRPDLFTERLPVIAVALCFYLGVCIAGGIYDVATRHHRESKLFSKPTRRDLLWLAFIAVMLGLLMAK